MGVVTACRNAAFFGLMITLLFTCTINVHRASAAGTSCSSRLQDFGVPLSWVDEDSEAGCIVRKCRADYESCTRGLEPLSEMVLVFSDEFETPGRMFASSDEDQKWTASDLHYTATQDLQAYKPDAVTTAEGNLKIEISRAQTSAYGINVESAQKSLYDSSFKSGQLSSWNKFCFTGGYLEFGVKLPGDFDSYGLWPAIWLLGNLAKAGYVNSTSGFWPYSFNHCDGSQHQDWSSLPGQRISACANSTHPDRQKFQLKQGMGRGAPEIDILEIQGTPTSQTLVQSLQMAPLLPPGLSWLDGNSQGVYFPGDHTGPSQWYGELSGDLPRPGTTYVDSMSAVTDLYPDDYRALNTLGLDWLPGKYMRWYWQGNLLYEVSQESLKYRRVANHSVQERDIPMEPMYILLQVAMSHSWSAIDPHLPFPATMDVDYVRLYQEPGKYNLGCSTPDFPTSQWIACHPQDYIVTDSDNILIADKCESPEELPDALRDEFGSSSSSLVLELSCLGLTFSLAVWLPWCPT